MRFTHLFFLTLLVIPCGVFAMTVETDMTREREAFPSFPLTQEGVSVRDASGDLTLFDREGRGAPPILADLTEVSLTPRESGWTARFAVTDSLPQDPGMPVNFDMFVAREGSAFAEDGVFRAGSDLAFLLLFGTKTKWHTTAWSYDAASRRWNELPIDQPFTIGEKEVSFTIPYTALARDARGSIRFFALTSREGGGTAVDIAPGDALPALRAVPPSNVTAPDVPSPTAPATGFPLMNTMIIAGVILLGSVLAFWTIKRSAESPDEQL